MPTSVANIRSNEEHTSGVTDLGAFAQDALVYDAVERCLERISEAARKLGEEAEALCPGPPWPLIRGLGNAIRHEYDRVEPSRIWYTIQDHLPPLRQAVEGALAGMREQD